MELFGYDEIMGGAPIRLKPDGMIEISIRDVDGRTFWIYGRIKHLETDSLSIGVTFRGTCNKTGEWSHIWNR